MTRIYRYSLCNVMLWVSSAVTLTLILSMVSMALQVYRPASEVWRKGKERVLLFALRDGFTLMVLEENDSLLAYFSQTITGWTTSLSITPTTHVRDSAWPGMLTPSTTMSTVGGGRAVKIKEFKETVHFSAGTHFCCDSTTDVEHQAQKESQSIILCITLKPLSYTLQYNKELVNHYKRLWTLPPNPHKNIS